MVKNSQKNLTNDVEFDSILRDIDDYKGEREVTSARINSLDHQTSSSEDILLSEGETWEDKKASSKFSARKCAKNDLLGYIEKYGWKEARLQKPEWGSHNEAEATQDFKDKDSEFEPSIEFEHSKISYPDHLGNVLACSTNPSTSVLEQQAKRKERVLLLRRLSEKSRAGTPEGLMKDARKSSKKSSKSTMI
ncbi:hypothetical protein TorRG33x02_303750 [Trema orientale]|uniref:Uncharacterized protein n=1 Tax=Trema orientale TaxID=63057 RepID=A0A2P5BYX1_TREOI|nr:hypothetical protein TorRG33x02_303750 [Trema orientale]